MSKKNRRKKKGNRGGAAGSVGGSTAHRVARTGIAGGDAGAAGLVVDQAEGEIRVPVVEERLAVDTREAELGEVQIRKTVEVEEQILPVTLRYDQVNVREVDIADRPLRPGDDAFREGTIRVPLRGEEAIVSKEAVVTGEVVIDRETVVEERRITDTVRKQHVDVEEHYREARADLQRAYQARQASDASLQGRVFDRAEPHYRSGFAAGHDQRYADQEFEQAEPALRREYESGGRGGAGEDTWERLREDIREGWNRARNR